MLDTWLVGRSRLRGAQSRAAAIFSGAGLRATHVTIAGAVIGTLSALAFACRLNAAGVAALWLSATLDAIDGTMARDFEGPTAMGGVLDLTADRLVEAAVLLGIAWHRPYLNFAALTVVASWYVNITVFLAVGAALETREKLIRYPPGLLERTEALVFFTLLIFAGRTGIGLCYAYAVLEIWTAIQRLGFALRELR